MCVSMRVHVCLWVVVVWDSLAGWLCVVWIKRGGGAQRRRALSIIHPTRHDGNPPEGGQRSVRTRGNLWGVNLNRRGTTTEVQEEGDEEDGRWQAGMGERKVQREGGQWGKREMLRGWQVIVAVGVTGSRQQTEERMRRCIDIPHKTVSSHLKGSLWLQTPPFTLTPSILWLPLADASSLRQWKIENGYTMDWRKPENRTSQYVKCGKTC